MKRILLIIGFVTVVVLLVLLIWYFFFRPLPAPPEEIVEEPVTVLPVPGLAEPPTPIPTILEIPSAKTAEEAKGGPVQTPELESNRNINPQLSPDGKSIVTFDTYDGKFYRVTPDGKTEALSDQTFTGATDVTWSPKSDKAIVEFLDDTKIVYDFNRKQQVATLPKHWESFTFSPDSESISFKSIAPDPENSWFAIANADGSGGELIEPMGKRFNQFTPLWSPSDQIVGLFEEGLDANRKKLYFIGKNGENFKSVTVEGRDLRAQWSPQGTQLLYSAYSGKSGFRPEVWIVDGLGDTIGNNRRQLGVQTWADKCAFADNTTLYCAVPKNIPEGAGLLPVIAEEKSGGEQIYKIDLATGEKRKIAEPRSDLIAQHIQITSDQQMLTFTDKYSGKLYRIQLR